MANFLQGQLTTNPSQWFIYKFLGSWFLIKMLTHGQRILYSWIEMLMTGRRNNLQHQCPFIIIFMLEKFAKLSCGRLSILFIDKLLSSI